MWVSWSTDLEVGRGPSLRSWCRAIASSIMGRGISCNNAILNFYSEPCRRDKTPSPPVDFFEVTLASDFYFFLRIRSNVNSIARLSPISI